MAFSETVGQIFINLLSAGIGWAATSLYNNRKHLLLAAHSKIIWNESIRLSVSYLFQIKIDNKYLLIKGGRIDQYQPVGGVFKMFESFKEDKRRLELINDECFTIDNASDQDLRIKVKGKNLIKFIKWFDSRKNREVGVHREFYEELIKSEIIGLNSMISFTPEYLKTVRTKIMYSKHFKCKELLIYEIYEVNLSAEDTYAIKKLIESKSEDRIILATAEEIERECILLNNLSKKIGQHAKHIL